MIRHARAGAMGAVGLRQPSKPSVFSPGSVLHLRAVIENGLRLQTLWSGFPLLERQPIPSLPRRVEACVTAGPCGYFGSQDAAIAGVAQLFCCGCADGAWAVYRGVSCLVGMGGGACRGRADGRR